MSETRDPKAAPSPVCQPARYIPLTGASREYAERLNLYIQPSQALRDLVRSGGQSQTGIAVRNWPAKQPAKKER